MKVVVGQCYTKNLSYGEYSEKINSEYCKKNNYIYHLETDELKIKEKCEDRSPHWYKPILILDILKKYPDCDYVLFLDIDAVFIDHNKRIEDYIVEDFSMMMTEDYGPSLVNSGVLFFKNDEYTLDFLNNWWSICEEYPEYKTGLWHDQTCIQLLYDRISYKNRFLIVSNVELNSSLYKKEAFIFHAFSYGNIKNRTLDKVYYDIFNIEPVVDDTNLMDLAEIYTTDKHYLHNYFRQVYQDLFLPIKDSTLTFIEIGILDGNSLRVFKRFFKNANIYGVDLKSDSIDGNIEVIRCDQSNPEELSELSQRFKDVDIILDDGSHRMYDQQVTLARLFPVLKQGGLYIIEDLHTSVECLMPEKSIFGWGDPLKTTTLQMLEDYNNTGKIKSDYLTTEEIDYIEKNIQDCRIFFLNNGASITSVIKKL